MDRGGHLDPAAQEFWRMEGQPLVIEGEALDMLVTEQAIAVVEMLSGMGVCN
jgi:hypothetical protein